MSIVEMSAIWLHFKFTIMKINYKIIGTTYLYIINVERCHLLTQKNWHFMSFSEQQLSLVSFHFRTPNNIFDAINWALWNHACIFSKSIFTLTIHHANWMSQEGWNNFLISGVEAKNVGQTFVQKLRHDLK